MPKLADHRREEIINTLENSFLTAAGYDIIEQPKGSSLIVAIKVKDFPGLYISLGLEARMHNLALPRSETYLECLETPGDYLNDQSTELSDFNGFLERLRIWCKRVQGQILSSPDTARDRLNSLRGQFEKQFSEYTNQAGDGDALFTDEEKEDLRVRLEQLEKNFEKVLSQQHDQKQKIQELHKIIKEMGKAADALPKNAWYKTLINRLAPFLVSDTGKALIEATWTIVKSHLLPPGGQ